LIFILRAAFRAHSRETPGFSISAGKGNLKELQRRTHLLPQLPRAGNGMTRFRCRLAFGDVHHRT
jgi:hypothetical protein